MRKIGVLLVISVALITLNTCAEKTKKETKAEVKEKILIENFDWLLGEWKRNNEAEGKETFEVWQKKSNSEYLGIGFTIQQNDTISKENIQLIKSADKWVLKVQTPDESTPITFDVTSYNEKEFICENTTHDFPKLIKYWKNGKKINALVSGDDMKIEFEFEKILE